ncbi:MAG: hypothetical protein RI554_11575 [Trueperaceae bacterium]|nr:hypothetical protein [Trueperaceae bacterium]
MRQATINRLLRDRITLLATNGVDAFGQPTTTQSTIPAYVKRDTARGVTDEGTEFTSNTQFVTTNPVHVGDRITIAGHTRTVRQVKQADAVRGGVTLYEVLL